MTQNATPYRPLIARVFVDEVLECAHRAGVTVPAMLRDLRLGYDDLDDLDPAQFARLWLMASEQMGDEFFGLAARPMPPGSFTLLGHAVRGAQTFEIAIRRALRFLKVVLGDPVGELAVSDTQCTVTLLEPSGTRSPFAYRTFFLILHGLNCWLVKERIPLQRVEFPSRRPAGQSDYGDFFGVPVTFEAPMALIEFDAKYLTRRVRRSEPDLKAFLKTTPEAFLRGYRPGLGLKAKILDQCMNTDFRNWPTTPQIAEHLGLSISTLHRKLREEGHSIRAIKEERRRAQATYLLKTTDLPIATIAEMVGYAEPSAFHRAFNTWFTMTPNAMRHAQLGN